MNRLLPVSEVARLLGVNRNFVYKLIKKGELQSYKIGSVKARTEVWRCTYKSVENVARVA